MASLFPIFSFIAKLCLCDGISFYKRVLIERTHRARGAPAHLHPRGLSLQRAMSVSHSSSSSKDPAPPVEPSAVAEITPLDALPHAGDDRNLHQADIGMVLKTSSRNAFFFLSFRRSRTSLTPPSHNAYTNLFSSFACVANLSGLQQVHRGLSAGA